MMSSGYAPKGHGEVRVETLGIGCCFKFRAYEQVYKITGFEKMGRRRRYVQTDWIEGGSQVSKVNIWAYGSKVIPVYSFNTI